MLMFILMLMLIVQFVLNKRCIRTNSIFEKWYIYNDHIFHEILKELMNGSVVPVVFPMLLEKGYVEDLW